MKVDSLVRTEFSAPTDQYRKGEMAMIRTWLLVVVWSVFVATASMAGPHAGGTLVVHALDVEYSIGQNYCSVQPLDRCSDAVPRVDSTDLRVWMVYAMFSEEQHPDLRGIEFGIDYSSNVFIVSSGKCGVLEIPSSGWPQSGSGTQVVWSVGQTEIAIPVYWFAGYAYIETAPTGEATTFAVGPHPQFGGHFGDGSIVPILDQIADYGVLGFGTDGSAPCPTPRVFRIRADGTGDYPTIKAAMDIAAPGSTIELEDGVYRGDGNRDLDFNDTFMTLRSVSGNPETCVIDCEGSRADNHRGIFVNFNHAAGPRVEGIKIVNGHVGSNGHWAFGGGGIDLSMGSRLVVVNCIIESCTSDIAGGGIGSGGGTIEMFDCIVRDNWTPGNSGAGLSAVDAYLRMENCRFEGNSLTGWGGAIRVTNCALDAVDCTFAENSATEGSAIAIRNTRANFEGCTWIENTASEGGTIRADDSEISLENCTIAGNVGPTASGIVAASDVDLELRSSILAFGEIGPAVSCGLPPSVTSTDIYMNGGGDWVGCLDGLGESGGNLQADPLFCGLETQNLSLDSRSPCVRRVGFDNHPIGAWPVGCGPTWTPLTRPVTRQPAARLWVVDNPAVGSVRIRGSVRAVSGSAALLVYDLMGRRVRTITLSSDQPGEFEVSWDGDNERGLRAPAGTYFCTLQENGQIHKVRFTLIR